MKRFATSPREAHCQMESLLWALDHAPADCASTHPREARMTTDSAITRLLAVLLLAQLVIVPWDVTRFGAQQLSYAPLWTNFDYQGVLLAEISVGRLVTQLLVSAFVIVWWLGRLERKRQMPSNDEAPPT